MLVLLKMKESPDACSQWSRCFMRDCIYSPSHFPKSHSRAATPVRDDSSVFHCLWESVGPVGTTFILRKTFSLVPISKVFLCAAPGFALPHESWQCCEGSACVFSPHSRKVFCLAPLIETPSAWLSSKGCYIMAR